MSSSDDLTDLERLDRRIEVLSGAGLVPEEHLDRLRDERAEHAGEDPGTTANDALTGATGAADGDPDDIDLAEALRQCPAEALEDPAAMEAEIEALQAKLDKLGGALPDGRVAEVETQIEALRAATEAHNPYLTNTIEALAARIEEASDR